MSNSASLAPDDPLASPLGATLLSNNKVRFLVWAPKAREAAIEIVSPGHRIVDMTALANGYYYCDLEQLPGGASYFYRLDGGPPRPDPASRFQPEGVHAPSRVVDLNHSWSDKAWRGRSLDQYIIYELHIGAFTPEGTFDAAIERLDELAALGVTAVEPLPIAQFPGARNWGYDGVHPFAPQNTYGGPDGFFRFVDACHARSLAVVLDVVFNHLGPEGNYFGEFGYYFTPRYRTPWGEAMNFDGRSSDQVRRFFIENAVYWIRDFHVDALRLDAVHAIFDNSARPFLRELAEAVRAAGARSNRQTHTFAESNQNDPRMTAPRAAGGLAIDAQWNDDLHHALHVALTGECDGYYRDFQSLSDLGKALAQGFIYDGQYSSYRGRRHGDASTEIPAEKLVVCSQNHDQVGNRLAGDRLATLVSFEQLKLAASLVLLSPYTPLLFMGEEYGETAPFLYFISHLDANLVDSVRKGRRAEFAAFQWQSEIPDPQSEATFGRCKLLPPEDRNDQQRVLFAFYQRLIALRKTTPALAAGARRRATPLESPRAISMHSESPDGSVFCLFHFGEQSQQIPVALPAGRWRKLLDSSDQQWLGDGGLQGEIFSPGEAALERRPGSALVLAKTLPT